jgi:hypothetical protein
MRWNRPMSASLNPLHIAHVTIDHLMNDGDDDAPKGRKQLSSFQYNKYNPLKRERTHHSKCKY